VIHRESALTQHLFKIAITQWIAQVPPYTQQNHLGLKMTPFEGTWLAHAGIPPACSNHAEPTTTPTFFATEPQGSVLFFQRHVTSLPATVKSEQLLGALPKEERRDIAQT
jgi:hypothetical protein